jgi:hypothetical protein
MDRRDIKIEEIRIDVRDPLLSHFYVRISCVGPVCDPHTLGWHHKSFPVTKNVLDIVKDWQMGLLHPVDWPVVALET